MIDLKILKSAVEQLAEERGLDKGQILTVIEDALAAAFKKDYGKKGQVIRAKFDPQSGKTEFSQIKLVVDESMIKPEGREGVAEQNVAETDTRVRFNEEHHLMLEDARKIKNDIKAGEELIFPLAPPAGKEDEFGRIAAQTAKQVIIQRLREAEKQSVIKEFSGRAGEIVSGKVQRVEYGTVFVDLGRAVGLLPREEQIPGEYYRQGERIKVYLAAVEESGRGVALRLSRAHPQFVANLFAFEVPEIANGLVEIRAVAREPGSRTKIAVIAKDSGIDPVGACVGSRGVRVNTITNELGGEKIDIIEWSDDAKTFITQALSPAKIKKVALNEEDKQARVEVAPDQFSLAVGRGGQNVRLAARLTGWKIDISQPPESEEETGEATGGVEADKELGNNTEDETI